MDVQSFASLSIFVGQGSGESIQNTLTAEDVHESWMGARQRRAPGDRPPFVWEPDLHRSEPIQLDLEGASLNIDRQLRFTANYRPFDTLAEL